MALLPFLAILYLSIGQTSSQTGSSFYYYYSPNQPMVVNSQTFGSNAQAHQQLLSPSKTNNPFNLQNNFGSSGSNAEGFQPPPNPYVTSSPFIPRRQQYQQSQYQAQPTYSSSLLDKINFANAPTTQQSPEINPYYNQFQQQSTLDTTPRTAFPGQPQPSAKLFNFLNQPFQFFQNSFNRFPNPQQQQVNNEFQERVPTTSSPQQTNENNGNRQQYFYNYYDSRNQPGSYQVESNKEEPVANVNPGLNYNLPKDGMTYSINQYFSQKTTQGPPTSYTFTIGSDPTTGPTATVHVSMGNPKDLPPPPKLNFPSRLIPIRTYGNEEIAPVQENLSIPEQEEDFSIPQQPEIPANPEKNYQDIYEAFENSTEILKTTEKPEPMVVIITNRKTTTEANQMIISATTTSTTTSPLSTSTLASTTATTTKDKSSSTFTMTEEPSPSTTTTPVSTTTTLATSTTTKPTPIPKEDERKATKRIIIRKKVPRKRLPPHGKNNTSIPEPERLYPQPEQDIETSSVTVQPLVKIRNTTQPIQVITRRLRVRITTTPPTTTTTTASNTPEPEAYVTSNTPIPEVYTTTVNPTEELATFAPISTTSRRMEVNRYAPEYSQSSTPSQNDHVKEDEEILSSTTTIDSIISLTEKPQITKAPYIVEMNEEDDTFTNVATIGPSLQESSTEAIMSTTSTTPSTTTFSSSTSSDVISTQGSISHQNGQNNVSPVETYSEYDEEYYEYYNDGETAGHTEASSSTASSLTFSDDRDQSQTSSSSSSTISPEHILTSNGNDTITEITEESISSTTQGPEIEHERDYESESNSSSTETNTGSTIFHQDDIIEPLSTTEASVSTTEDSIAILQNTESTDEPSSSTTVKPSIEKAEQITKSVSNTSESNRENPISEEVVTESSMLDYNETNKIPSEEGYLEEAHPTGSSSRERLSPQDNYEDDFLEEYNYTEVEDPLEDEKIAEAQRHALNTALRNIRNRQNSSSTTEKPEEEISDGIKKFIRRPIKVKAFPSTSSSQVLKNYDDEEIGDSRSQVIQKIQTFRTKLRKVTTVIRTTTKRPRRVTRPSDKSTSAETPVDLSHNENDISGNGKDEKDNEISRDAKAISSKKVVDDSVSESKGTKLTEEDLPQGTKEKEKSSVIEETNGPVDSQDEIAKPIDESKVIIPEIVSEETVTTKNPVTHVGELIIHEILPTTQTTTTTEATVQESSELGENGKDQDVDFETGSQEEGQALEHSTSISVAVSSEFNDDEDSSTTTQISRSRGSRGRRIKTTTTTTMPEVPEVPVTTTEEAVFTTIGSTSTTEEPLPIMPTEISVKTNVSQSESTNAPQRKVKVILKRRKGALGEKGIVARQVVRTRTRKRLVISE